MAKKPTLEPDAQSQHEINVKTWNLEAMDKIQELIGDAVNEALSLAVTYRNEITSPFLESGEGSPLDFQVEIPLGGDEDNPTWIFPLENAVDFFLDGATLPRTGKIDSEDAERATEFAKALRALADKIEAKI